MPYILARLKNVEFEHMKKLLKEHAPLHAKDGIYLEHLWQNADDETEAIFISRVDDLEHARKVIKKQHDQAREENPHTNLPTITFLT